MNPIFLDWWKTVTEKNLIRLACGTFHPSFQTVAEMAFIAGMKYAKCKSATIVSTQEMEIQTLKNRLKALS